MDYSLHPADSWIWQIHFVKVSIGKIAGKRPPESFECFGKTLMALNKFARRSW